MDVALRPAILSLCSGGAGLDLGACLAWERIVGAWPRVVGYVEREAYAAAALVAGMEAQALDYAPIWDDLTTFDGRPWRGKVDIITAGFPCQPFSLAGRRRGIKDERWLWPHISRVLGEVEPTIVFLENVPGLLTAGFGRVLGSMAEMGFDAEWGCFGAAEVGAAHLRKRLFILAYTDGVRRLQPQRSQPHERGRLGYGGQNVAYAPRSGCGQAECRQPQERQPLSNIQGMAHALREGLSDPRRGGQREGQDKLRGRLCFPPGPDSPEWAATSPTLKPAIRGMAHGVANRVDQLRMLGNGVVPLAAAYAFCTLWAAAMSE